MPGRADIGAGDAPPPLLLDESHRVPTRPERFDQNGPGAVVRVQHRVTGPREEGYGVTGDGRRDTERVARGVGQVAARAPTVAGHCAVQAQPDWVAQCLEHLRPLHRLALVQRRGQQLRTADIDTACANVASADINPTAMGAVPCLTLSSPATSSDGCCATQAPNPPPLPQDAAAEPAPAVPAHRTLPRRPALGGWIRRSPLTVREGASAYSIQQEAGGMLCSYWKTLRGSYFCLIWRRRSKLPSQ